MLNIELEAYHILVVLDDCSDLTKLSSVINELAIKKCFRRFVIHVISSDGRPTYLSRLRNFLQSIIPYTMIVRFEGMVVDNIQEVVKGLPKNLLTVVCGSELTSEFNELGVEYVVLGDN